MLQVDPERESAEQKALTLGAQKNQVQRLSDEELRSLLFRLGRGAASSSKITPRRLSTLQALSARLGWSVPNLESAQQILDALYAQFRVDVGSDGLIEVEEMVGSCRPLVDGLPLALYHHTSSALLHKIAEKGLLVGRQTNFFNTQAGVYLSLISGGMPVAVYSQRAAYLHGGDPITLRVRRTLDQLVNDPDDADLPRLCNRQFISKPVPPADLVDLVDVMKLCKVKPLKRGPSMSA
jgi:hypothetical protein